MAFVCWLWCATEDIPEDACNKAAWVKQIEIWKYWTEVGDWSIVAFL